MLASILNSPTAIRLSVRIVRTFIQLRKFMASHANLARKLRALEQKYHYQLKKDIEAIEQLASPKRPRKNRMGFLT